MKNKLGVIGIAIGLTILLSTSPVWAQGKIGFIDMRAIITSSDAGKQAAAEFKKTFEKRKAAIQQAENELKKLKDALEKQRSVLKQDAIKDKEMDYQKRYRDYQRLVADSNEELAARDQQLSQKMIPEVLKIVNTFGEREGYSLILDINNPVVVFHSKGTDLTKRIVAEMNKTAPAKNTKR